MKIPRKQPTQPTPVIWDEAQGVWKDLADHINNPGTWEVDTSGQHSHGIFDPGHSHGVTTGFCPPCYAIVVTDRSQVHRARDLITQTTGIQHPFVRVCSVDTADSARGIAFNGAVLQGIDQTSDIFKLIIHPALMDSKGWVKFI